MKNREGNGQKEQERKERFSLLLAVALIAVLVLLGVVFVVGLSAAERTTEAGPKVELVPWICSDEALTDCKRLPSRGLFYQAVPLARLSELSITYAPWVRFNARGFYEAEYGEERTGYICKASILGNAESSWPKPEDAFTILKKCP